MDWAKAFVLTQVVEVPIYMGLLGLTRGRRLSVALLASGLTHPYVWFVLPVLIPVLGYNLYVAIAETFAVLVEAGFLVLFGTVPRRALLIALAANAASYGLGTLIF